MASNLSTNLARNARRLRDRRGLTLTQLADRSGIAKATLSQIESGSGNPTLHTLQDLAAALSTDVEQLLASGDEEGIIVVRRDEGTDVGDDAVAARLVHAAGTDAAKLEFHCLQIAAGHREVSASHGAGSREFAIVAAGSVRLGPMGDERVLSAGDFASYRVDGPHLWEAAEEDATVWIALVQPS
ncbi:helix-turn-helix domain-containing protein [Arthrobacter sp. GCM10027362]|uniref:helix-turn-helix domain-containing protein n=1 Tax=Arthrobacter sp. GCM10027362 TaxID=3273379 RepID=UPI00362F61C2